MLQAQLFPDHFCYDKISLQPAGASVELVLTERRDENGEQLRLRRGEFCLTPADPADGKGGRMVDVCLPRNKTNIFSLLYPVMFGLSAFCLLITNIFYFLLRRKTFLNNLLFHYTLMLFLAYTALILIQRPALWTNWFITWRRLEQIKIHNIKTKDLFLIVCDLLKTL